MPVQAARTGVSQALADDARVIGDCDLRVGDIRVPELFPFEAVKSLVMNRTESLNLALDRNIPSPGQHIQTRLLIFMRAVASFIRLRPPPTQEFKTFMRVLSRRAFQAAPGNSVAVTAVARARDSVPKQFCSLFFYFIKCGAESQGC